MRWIFLAIKRISLFGDNWKSPIFKIHIGINDHIHRDHKKNWFIKRHLIRNSEEMKYSIQNTKPNDVYLHIYSTLWWTVCSNKSNLIWISKIVLDWWVRKRCTKIETKKGTLLSPQKRSDQDELSEEDVIYESFVIRSKRFSGWPQVFLFGWL